MASRRRQVDIRDLSWEDKERVLRLLFAKINQSQGAVSAAAVGGGGPASAVSPPPEGPDTHIHRCGCRIEPWARGEPNGIEPGE